MSKDEDKKKRDLRMEEMRKMVEESKKIGDKHQPLLPLPNDTDGEDIGFDAALLGDTANPDQSHKLYYGMQGMLKSTLPSGKANEKLRQFVNDEKNLFLNRGRQLDSRGIRGSDGRQTYITPFLEIAFNTAEKWVQSGDSPFDLYMAFRQLNEESGYYDTQKAADNSEATDTSTDETPAE